jgi:predicted O-methyltransferase YrrM
MSFETDFEEMLERHHANDAGFCRHYMTLYSIVLGMEAKKVFEFGSGYSSKTILKALSHTDGHLYSCDMRRLKVTAAKYDLEDEEMNKNMDRWTYIQGKSLDVQDKVPDVLFDVVLHDASHKWQYVKKDLEFIVPKMKNGGLLLVHDTKHPTHNYNLGKAIEWLKKDNDCVTLPYGYGLSIIKVKTKNESIKIDWRKQ